MLYQQRLKFLKGLFMATLDYHHRWILIPESLTNSGEFMSLQHINAVLWYVRTCG